MVNYQGPQCIRKIVDRLDIRIFNRVQQVSFVLNDLNEFPVDGNDFLRLTSLQTIVASQKGRNEIDAGGFAAVESLVPLTRVKLIQKTSHQIILTVRPG